MSNERPRPGSAREEGASTESPQAHTATYSEQQVAQILQRVAQLERGRASQKQSLTLAEVEAIARESGLDPSLVQLAARSIAMGGEESAAAHRFIGAPMRQVFERVIDGELSTIEHEWLSAELRSIFRSSSHEPPQIASVGRSLIFNSRTRAGRVQLELLPREGKTLLRLEVSAGNFAGMLFGALFGSGTVLAPPLVASLLGAQVGIVPSLLAAAGLLGGLYSAARGLFGRSARREYERMERLADQLAARLGEALAARKRELPSSNETSLSADSSTAP